MRITIIGAGFSGGVLATELARHAPSDTDIRLVGVADSFGRGVAYGEARAEHLLNVRARELGAIHGASTVIRLWRPQAYYDEPGRGTLARDGGGVLLTQAIHTLDLLLSLAGDPAEVCAFATTTPIHRME